MIADLLPKYYRRYPVGLRYKVLQSFVIDGHEVAWMEYTGPIIINDKHHSYTGRTMKCECDFAEGIGWRLDEKLQFRNLSGPNGCLKRQAALYLRHLELRQEYHQRFVEGDYTKLLGVEGCVREVTLDLIEKAKAGEWLEDREWTGSHGMYFFMHTVASITGIYIGHIWDDIYPLLNEKLFGLEGTIVTDYTEPPPEAWEEFVRVEGEDGRVGMAFLPAHRQMAQEWKFQVLNPSGQEALPASRVEIDHNPAYGPDIEDLKKARLHLNSLLDQARRRN